jgi:hypothetical protein
MASCRIVTRASARSAHCRHARHIPPSLRASTKRLIIFCAALAGLENSGFHAGSGPGRTGGALIAAA